MPTNSELINERMAIRLREIYTRSEVEMLGKIKRRVARGITDKGFYNEKYDEAVKMQRELSDLMDDSAAMAKEITSDGLVKSYFSGKKEVSLGSRKGFPDIATADFVPHKIQRLVLETENLIDGTSFQVVRGVQDAYRKVTTDVTGGVLAGSDTVHQAAQKALNSYAARGITGFVDKAGRKWDLQSYTTMAVRTTAQRASLQGHVDRMQELGRDLVIVSTKNATCPICAPWSNMILSISGTSVKHPSIDAAKSAGLFHPNCQHTLLDYDEDEQELDKILGIEDDHKDVGKKAILDNNDEVYKATQIQRYNESKIRKYKRLDAVALDEEAHKKARAGVRHFQEKNRDLCDKYSLPRDYSREGNFPRDASKAINYKEYDPLKLVRPVQPVTPPVTPPVAPTLPPAIVQPKVPSVPKVNPKPYEYMTKAEILEDYIKKYEEMYRAKGMKVVGADRKSIIDFYETRSRRQVLDALKSLDNRLGYVPKVKGTRVKKAVAPVAGKVEAKVKADSEVYVGSERMTNFTNIKGVTKDQAKIIVEKYDKLPVSLRAAEKRSYQKPPKVSKIPDSETSCYWKHDKSIDWAAKRDSIAEVNLLAGRTVKQYQFRTLFHEYGHFIDDALYRPSKNPSFISAIKKDINKLCSTTSYGGAKVQKTSSELIRDLTNFNGERYTIGIQDAISGVKRNSGIYVNYSHSKKYWDRGVFEEELGSEVFAHCVSAYTDDAALAAMNNFMPETMKQFDSLIEDYLSNTIK